MIHLNLADIDPDKIEGDRLQKHITVSLLIPARGLHAAKCLGDIIEANRREWMERRSVIDEIGVHIDPDDEGNTYNMELTARQAGATWVITGQDAKNWFPGAEDSRTGGKAAAMRNLAHFAMGSRLVFHDADLTNYDPMTCGAMVGALAGEGTPLFVNGSPKRKSADGAPGGRTTEMVRSILAKQLHRYVPEITKLRQPLIGEFAIDAALFASLEFARGYGVEATLKSLALRALPDTSAAEMDLPVKQQEGQNYLDLVKQFHEISFGVDVLERHFQLLEHGTNISPREIALDFDKHFPGRTLELIRPDGFDAKPFEPRINFYGPLMNEPSYVARDEEIESLRTYARHALMGRRNPQTIHV